MNIFDIVPWVFGAIFIFVIGAFIISLLSIFGFFGKKGNPIFNRMMKTQINSLNTVVDENKQQLTNIGMNLGDVATTTLSNIATNNEEELTNIGTTLGKVGAKTYQTVLKENYETMQENATHQASINKKAIQTITKTFKEGLSKEETIFCKHCGESIDSESKFCQHCGKQQ